MSAQQKVLAPRQSARTGEVYPWDSWTLMTKTSTTSENVPSEDSSTSTTFSSPPIPATSPDSAVTGCISTLLACVIHPNEPLPTSPSSAASHIPTINDQTSSNTTLESPSYLPQRSSTVQTSSSSPNTSSPSAHATNVPPFSLFTTLYSITITVTSNQTPNSGLLQIQADPAAHGILAASIVSSVLIVLALSAVLGWWLVRKAKKGYRYGLMKETKRPMF